MNFADVLVTKPHNPHYLNRYIKLILACRDADTSDGVYRESHHVCPRSRDMFPEYKDFRSAHQWNKIVLTDRQHFLAHHLLAKAYPWSRQTYAFKCMASNQTPGHVRRGVKRVSSKTYAIVKDLTRNIISESNTGMSTYRDTNGNKVRCKTTDPRVLSGELTSLTLGRKHVRKADRTAARSAGLNARWVMYPVRRIDLYFLDMKISIEYARDDYPFLEYIEQGWQTSATTEWCSARSLNSNLTRTPEARKRAGESHKKSHALKKELGLLVPRIVTKEQCKQLRRKVGKVHDVLCFNLETKEIKLIDQLDVAHPFIVCCNRAGGRFVFDQYGVRSWLDVRVDAALIGKLEQHPDRVALYFNTETRIAGEKKFRDVVSTDIRVLVPHTAGRWAYRESVTNACCFWHRDLIPLYGIPINYQPVGRSPGHADVVG